MNWKTLLVIASLTLSAGLTACNKEASTTTETKTETTKPAESTAPAATTTETKTETNKPADGMKAGETKTETKTIKPAETKKP